MHPVRVPTPTRLADLDTRLAGIAGRLRVLPTPQALRLVGGAEAAERMLAPYELRRGAALHRPPDRDDHLAAHALVREVAGHHPERPRLLRQSCAQCGGTDHGRPRISGHPAVEVSLAHAHGWVAAVAASKRCGIDVEPLTPTTKPVATVLTAAEHASLRALGDTARVAGFLRLWTRKEALVKVGLVALDDVGDVDVRAPELVAGALLVDVPAPPGTFAALAIAT